jgi:hypothetical protein
MSENGNCYVQQWALDTIVESDHSPIVLFAPLEEEEIGDTDQELFGQAA